MKELGRNPHTPTHRLIFSFISACALIALLVEGCGTMRNGQTQAFAFVTNSGTGTVSAFAVDASGRLLPVPDSPFTSGTGAEFLVFDKVHKFLFVANSGANTLSVFSVNAGTGTLTAAPGSPFATGATPLGVAVDPMGKFVFVANQTDNTVSVFSINGGTLAAAPGSPFAGVANPFGLSVNSTGTFLFVSGFNGSTGSGNTVSAFAINSVTGALTSAGSATATSSPAGITAPIGLVNDGKLLFVGDHMAEAVVPFSINAVNGALTPVSTLPAPATGCSVSCHNNPLRLAIDPADKFIYSTNVQAGTLSTFSINNGSLAAVAETSVGQHPFGLAFDPTGSFLYVVNKADSTISGFSVDPNTGTVSALPGSPFPERGNAPTDIVIVARQ